MNDCRFVGITMRDITIAVSDTGANTWIDIHPWLGTTAQLTARYQNSVAFLIGGNSVLIAPYADTYRYAFRSGAASGFAVARIIAPEVYANPGNLTNGLAASYPGVVFDIADTGGAFIVTNGRFTGHPVTNHTLVSGTSKRLSVKNSLPASYITGFTGFNDHIRGVLMGVSSFTPNIFGASTSGTHTYTVQEGRMEVRDGVVSYRFKVKATLGVTTAGNLRIGGLPFPTEAASTDAGQGPITYSTGGLRAGGVIGANGTSSPLAAIPVVVDGGPVDLVSRAADLSAVATAEVSSVPYRGALLEIWGQIDCTFNYQSW